MRRFLNRFLLHFRHLQWELTGSSILITTLGLLVAIGLATLVLIQFVIAQYPQNASNALLAGAPPTIHDLKPSGTHQNLIDDLWAVDYSVQAGYTDPNTGASAVVPSQEGYTLVVGVDGRVLASTDTDVMPEGSVLSRHVSAIGMDVVRAAIRSKVGNKPIVVLDQEQRLYAALPLFTQHRQLAGILLTVHVLPSYGQVVVALFLLLWPTLALIIGAVVIVGALFGSFMARWLVRRFTSVTQAAECWSQGDFSATIADRSGDELGVMARQLNAVAGRLERLLRERQDVAVLEERHRMARELHDSLKQQLFAGIMQIWSAQLLLDTNTSAVKQQLATVEHLLGQAQQELSTLIYQLRPLALVEKPLAEALRDYCEQWAHQHSMTLELDIEEVALSLNADETLFRVTQEALSNIARHSGASTVQLHLLNQQEQVILTITDNGQGFDLEQVGGQGIGLQSMRERMEMLQGTLSIASKRGHGTQISAVYTKGSSSRLQASVPLF